MSEASRLDDSREQRLEQALAEYLRSVEAGQPVDRNVVLAIYPDLVDELQSFFGNRDAMQELARPLQDAAGKIAAGDELTMAHGPGDHTLQAAGLRIRYFGDYELLLEIARGGMGVVYKARQESLKRVVALKMILSGQLASAEDVSRFQQEAEAAANLDHPHIVPIYEIGEHEGQHYFSMKLIEGGSLAQQLREQPGGLALRDAANMMAVVARAVHHAHQRGLLHRDLKPGNILLDATGQPQVTDFGLARRVEGDSDLTRSGTVVGTPNYMAPEQARAQKQISTAADVYSLGAILYEMLVGQPPFRGENAVDTIMQVLSREPKHPRSLNPRIDRDLETICLKCLEKEPQRRYDSAAALADDLDRWLRGEPILARPAGKIERVTKWARRHPSIAALASLLVLVVVVGFGLVTWKWQEASQRAEAERQAKEETKAALDRSQQFAYQAQLARAGGLIERDPWMAAALFDQENFCPPERRDFAWRYYRRLSHRELRRLAPEGIVIGDREAPMWGPIESAVVSPDCTHCALVTAKNEIFLSSVATGKREAMLPGHVGKEHALAFSPDSKILATGGEDGLVKLWSALDGQPLATLTWQLPDGKPRRVMSLAFDPGGKTLAVGGAVFDIEKDKKDRDGRYRSPVIWVWDVASRNGKALTSFAGRSTYEIDNNGVYCLAYSPDGKTLAAGLTRSGAVALLDTQTSAERKRLQASGGWTESVAFSPDGKSLAFGKSNGDIFLGEVATGKVVRTLHGHLDDVWDLQFTPAGTLLSGSRDANLRIWDSNSGDSQVMLRCETVIRAISLVPRSDQIIVVTARELQTWSLKPESTSTALRDSRAKDPNAGSTALALNEKGSLLAVAGQDEIVRLWDVAKQSLVHQLTGHKGRTTAVAFAPAGTDLLASGGEDNRVLLWRLRGPAPIRPLVLEGHTGTVMCLKITADGNFIVSGSLDGTVRQWDAATGKLVYTFSSDQKLVYSFDLSGDGKLLITGGDAGSLRVWDFVNRTLLATPPARKFGPSMITQVAISPDGRKVVTIHAAILALHKLDASGQMPVEFEKGRIAAVAFSRDGKNMAYGGTDHAVRIYDAASGSLHAELPGHTHYVRALAFNRDCTLLATVSRGWLHWDQRGEVLLWKAPFPEPDKP